MTDTKKRRSRRPKPTDERRRPRCIRYSNDEWKMIRALAEEAGKPVSVYVRVASLRPLRAPRVKSDMAPELIRQLIRIGNNLNQLTRYAAQGRDIDADALARTLRVIEATSKRIIEDP